MTKPSAGGRPGEDELIARYFAPIAGEGALGLKDDAAVLRPRPGHDLVVTVDAVVAGVHFLADDPAGSVARKALGVNLSDLAAKGAAPVGFVLTLTLPPDWSEAWLAAFCEGLGAAARASGCALLGGDTVRGPGIAISLTAFGEVPAGRMVPRTTARPGEVLCVSGTIGDAALGLAIRGSSVRLMGHRSCPRRTGNSSPTATCTRSPATGSRPRSCAPRVGRHGCLRRPRRRSRQDDAGGRHERGRRRRQDPALARCAGGARGRALLVRPPRHRRRRLRDPGRGPARAARAFLAASEKAGVATTAIGTVTEGTALPLFRRAGERAPLRARLLPPLLSGR